MTPNQNQTASPMRAERERQGLKARELAFFARSSPMAVSRLERGFGGSASLKARVARVLRVSVEDLWPHDGEEVVVPEEATGSRA